MKNVLFAFCVVMLGACQTTGNTKWHTVYDAGYGDNNDSSPAIITVVENTQNNNWSSNSNTNEAQNRRVRAKLKSFLNLDTKAKIPKVNGAANRYDF